MVLITKNLGQKLLKNECHLLKCKIVAETSSGLCFKNIKINGIFG
jgi:hypothetical protein